MNATPPPVKKRRLRWFQVSLRTFLLLLVGICVWLGVRVERARRQEKIIARVESTERNLVTYAHQMDGDGKLIPSAVPPGPRWLRQLTGDHFFFRPRLITLHKPDAQLLEEVSMLSGVEFVNLFDADNASIQPLARFSELRAVCLVLIPSEKTDLSLLAKIDSLEQLHLSGHWITDDDLRTLQPLRQLKLLDVSDTQVTAEGEAWARATWPGINLGKSVYPSSKEQIEVIKSLGDVNVRFQTDNAGNVIVAHLFGKETTDAHLVRIAPLKRLLMVYLNDTAVTYEGVTSLRRRLPVKVRPNLAEPTPEEAPVAEKLKSEGFEVVMSDDGYVQVVSSAKANVTDDCFANVATLGFLQRVHCESPLLTDQTIANLSGCTQLITLNLPNAEISSDGMQHLRFCTRLLMLHLRGTAITDDGLAALAGATRLHDVTLHGASLQGYGLSHFQNCTQLRRLDLSHSVLSDEALNYLPGSCPIHTLTLSNSNVSDGALAQLAPMPSLRTFVASSTPLTDAGLLHLRRHQSLNQVDVKDTLVTEAGVTEFNKVLPNCKVRY